MAATYDVTTHGLLSNHAQLIYNQDATAFDVLAEQAEHLLSVHETSFTGDELNRVKYAIVRQVNFMLEVTPEAQIALRVRRGARETQYKAGTVQELDSLARRIVLDLGVEIDSTASFPTIRSLR